MTATDATSELDSNLSEVAVALFAPGTLEATLQNIITLAVATVDGCDAAGVFLAENGQITTAASTDPVVLLLDRLQIDSHEGPCLDALAEEGTVYADDLATPDRWPQFAPTAVDTGSAASWPSP